MKPEEVQRLETAVRRANPVPHARDLVDTEDAAAVTILVEERNTMTNAPIRPTPQAMGPPLRRRSMAWAFAAGVVVTLLLGGTALLFTDRDARPVADQSATAVTSSVAPAATSGSAAPVVGGESLTLADHPEMVSAVDWSPDGTHLATAGSAIDGAGGVVKIWDAATGDELLSFDPGNSETVGVEMLYSPDGTRIAVDAAIYDVITGEELLSGISDGVLDFSPDGTRIAVGGAWGYAAVLDAATGAEQFALPGSGSWVWAAAWSPDGTRIATTSGSDVKVWNATNGDELLTLEGPVELRGLLKVRDVAWSPDGTRIATANSDGSAKVWDAGSGDELVAVGDRGVLTLTDRTGGVWAAAWSPDGTRIATAVGSDVKIWDAATGDELETLTGHTAQVTDVSWSPDGTWIATASYDGTAKIWSMS